MEQLTLLFIILCLTHTVEAVTGFGSTILAVTLAVHFIPLKELLPVLVMLNLLLNSYIVYNYFPLADHHLFWKRILPCCSLGLFLGMGIFRLIPTRGLLQIFGIFVVFLSSFELKRALLSSRKIPLLKLASGPKNIDLPMTPLPEEGKSSPPGEGWLLGGGVIQGMFASGGPMVVYYLSKRVTEKKVFRSTLSLLWLLLNTLLLGGFLIDGSIDIPKIKIFSIMIPSVLLGILVGERLHKRVSEDNFRKVVFLLLLVGGILLVGKR